MEINIYTTMETPDFDATMKQLNSAPCWGQKTVRRKRVTTEMDISFIHYIGSVVLIQCQQNNSNYERLII